VPDVPDEPVDVIDDKFDERKKREIFMQWMLPFDNEQPVLWTELSITELGEANGTSVENTRVFTLPAATQSFSLDRLQPATQYRCSLRVNNSYGWSSSSADAWLWTRPDVPTAFVPVCDPLASSASSFNVKVESAKENGLAVLEYELNVTTHDPPSFPDAAEEEEAADDSGSGDWASPLGYSVLFSASTGTALDDRLLDVTALMVEKFTDQSYGGAANQTLLDESVYAVSVRARNGEGWSEWTVPVNCSTTKIEKTPFPWLAVVVPIVLIVLLLIAFLVYCYRSNSTKIFAPKLRKKDPNDDPLKDFVSQDATPMEDADPELVMNPVLLARMEMEKQKAMAMAGKGSKKKGGVAGAGRTGGLARLGLKVEGVEGTKKAAKPINMQVDEFLHETMGVNVDKGQADRAEMKKLDQAVGGFGAEATEQNALAGARAGARKAGGAADREVL